MGLAEILMALNSGGGGGYAPPAPPPQQPPQPQSRIMAILQQLGAANAQPEPTWNTLPADDQRQARAQAYAALGQAIGGADEGHLGFALAAGVGQMGKLRQQAVDDAATEQRRQRQDQLQGLTRQLDAERALRDERKLSDQEAVQQRTQGALGQLASTLQQHLDPSDPRYALVDVAARTGDRSTLDKITESIHGDEEKKALAKRYGVDPNDPAALATAQAVEKEKALTPALVDRARQEALVRPREGQLVQDQNGQYVLVDQVSGAAKPTGVQGKVAGVGQTPDDRGREADLREATRLANSRRTEAMKQWQVASKDVTNWVQGADGTFAPPPPPQIDFENEVQQQFQMLQRTRAAAKPAPLVSPIEGNPAHAPTSATGPGKGKPQQPKYTADDVISVLPKGVVIRPEARQVIEQKLQSGATPQQIVHQILAEAGW